MRRAELLTWAALIIAIECKSSNSTSSTRSVNPDVKVLSTSVNSASTSSSNPSSSSSEPPTTSITRPWQTTGTDPPIPGALSTYCYQSHSPCTVRCASSDGTCLSAASSVAGSCLPQWTAYQNASATWALSHYGNGSYTVTRTETYYDVSTIFTSYSTDMTESFSNLYASALTYHPVYAFGPGVPSTVSAEYYTVTRTFASTDVRSLATTVTTETVRDTTRIITDADWVPVTTGGFTEQPPACAVTEVDSVECQQCQISGGTVELFFWPPEDHKNASSTVNATTTKAPDSPRTTIVSGITMVSPSVYISLHTVYASDGCSQVGGNHTQTVLAMDPDKVSTLFGARGAGYIPVDSARINYHDLVGAVPASQYERNPACARFGCITLSNDYYRPILSIPPEIRNLDPAWGGCRLDLGGLYDPPVALTPVANIARPTTPGDSPVDPGPSANPGTGPADPAAQPTTTPAPIVNDPPKGNQPSVPALPEQSPSPSAQPVPPRPNPSPPSPRPAPAQIGDDTQDPSKPAGSQSQTQDPQQQQPPQNSRPETQGQQPSIQASPNAGPQRPADAEGAGRTPSSAPAAPAANVPAAPSAGPQSGNGGSSGEGSIIAGVIGITAPDRTAGGSQPTSTPNPGGLPNGPKPGPLGGAPGNYTSGSTSTGASTQTSTAQSTNTAGTAKRISATASLLALIGVAMLAL